MEYHSVAEGNSKLKQENSSSLRQAGDVVRATVTFLVMVHHACIMVYMRHCTFLRNHHHETNPVRLDGFQKYVLVYIGLESNEPTCLTVSQLLSQAQSAAAKFQQDSEARYIDEAIILDREALELCTAGHPRQSACLFQLAYHLGARYELLGGVETLNEAILLDRDTLALLPPGHPDRSSSLNNLALHLATRYNLLGGVDDLNEAILLDRDALALRPPGHPDRSKSLNNLAVCLSTRYNLLGGVDDLNEAILLDRDALALRPPGHPDRSSSLNALEIGRAHV